MSAARADRFDVFAAPLRGQHTIEASAGTGKTWAITGLYVRLLLETELGVDGILVVTYTEAATAELRTRIYQRLAQARDALLADESDDPFCAELLTRHRENRRGALARLVNALRSFDEAAIFTIHGFCQRVLERHAFEGGAPMRIQVIGDQTDLLDECVQDFWRREVYGAAPLFVDYLLEQDLGPNELRERIARYVGKPFLDTLVPERPEGVREREERWVALFAKAKPLWLASRGDVDAVLGDPSRVKGNFFRRDWLDGWLPKLDLWFESQTPHLDIGDVLEKFCAARVRDASKGRAIEHGFFDLCSELSEAKRDLESAYHAMLQDLQARLLVYTDKELRRRKRERRQLYFDDLLIELEEALESERGPALAAAIRGRFGAALIDEFQDTDPLQYSIFQRIYRGHANPLFLVGDPKQAIYGFRGADVFAYLEAREDAETLHTLDENWRSDPPLIDAVNAIFESRDDPFVLERIPFHAAAAAPRELDEVHLEDPPQAPFRLLFLRRADGEKWIKRDDAIDRAANATADEIARLLTRADRGDASIGDRRLEGGDIAVLVRVHEQGRRIRRALAERGIPAVQLAPESVFATAEAEELERILMAIAEPGRERLVRAALATDLLGFGSAELHELGESENRWEDELDRFRDYRRGWLEKGIGRTLRSLLFEREVPKRLLTLPDGERRLTNVFQLAELIGQEADCGAGSEKLVEWLATRRRHAADDLARAEEHLLRLESDERLVQISTLHNAKGLEYRVVFCPFAWDLTPRLRPEEEPVFFHDPAARLAATLDFGVRPEESRMHARREALAESLRLLYVGLTRARHRCVMIWGAVRGAHASAPAWLFERPEASFGGDLDDSLAALEKRMSQTRDEDLLAKLDGVARAASGAISIETLSAGERDAVPAVIVPPRERAERLSARELTRDIEQRWWITSFTSLKRGRGAERGDYDGAVISPRAALEPLPATRDVFGFPRGALAGICLHHAFERLDFAERDRGALEVLARETLAAHGLPEDWVPVVAKLLDDVVRTPLDRAGTLRLESVGRESRLDEIEFHYPAQTLTLDVLNDLLSRHGYLPLRERPEEPVPSPLAQGYVKGIIDLVFAAGGRFYLADYKSNWLGSSLEAYAAERLPSVVQQELYTLQYLTYSVAVHRLLRLRVPGYDYDRHFGGAFYLFVRGMRPELGASSGVFFDQPPRVLIDALDERLGSGSGIQAAAAHVSMG